MAVQTGQGVFTATDARRYGGVLSIEYDGAEGLGLWFGIDDEPALALNIEDTKAFVNWVYDNFIPTKKR